MLLLILLCMPFCQWDSGEIPTHVSSTRYALGIGSVVSQSLYLTYVQKRGFKMDMLTILYVNSINCLPILVTIMLAIGEYPRLLAFDGWENPMVYVSLSGLLVVGGM